MAWTKQNPASSSGSQQAPAQSAYSVQATLLDLNGYVEPGYVEVGYVGGGDVDRQATTDHVWMKQPLGGSTWL